MRVSLLALLLAATAGITTKQAVTSAPGHAVNLAASSGTEGTSLAFMRADATLGVSGLLPDANLAGAYSGTGSCSASQWVRVLNRNAAATCSQPAFSDISGTVSDAALANAYSGVGACGANTWVSTLNRNASGTCTQPAFSSISGTASTAQIPSGLNTSILGAGTLGQARGGTGAGALTCSAGDFITSNGTAYSCATPAGGVTGPLMIAQFTLSGATTTVTGMPALNMVCICNDVSVGNTLCKATTSLAVMTITGTSGHVANIHCGPAQGTGSLSGGGF